MKRSTFFLVVALILSIFAALKILGIPPFISQAHAQSQEMGAYDIAVIPLEDVPEPGETVVRRSAGIPNDTFATMEVLRVIKDPRTIPIERFIYYKYPSSRLPQNKNEIDPSAFEERLALYDLITHPDADRIIERFTDESPSAVAVYVKTVGDVDLSSHYYNEEETPIPNPQKQIDPLYVQDPVRDYVEKNIYYGFDYDPFYHWQPWSLLAVADPFSDLNFPCMPVHSEEFPDPYVTPNTKSEFDPESYLPPQPWYSGDNYQMEEGEIREGWVLCLAPDIPVEECELAAAT